MQFGRVSREVAGEAHPEWVARQYIRVRGEEHLGNEFYQAVQSVLDDLCERCEFDCIEASGNGGFVWAGAGFGFSRDLADRAHVETSLRGVGQAAAGIQQSPRVSDEARNLLSIVREQLDSENPPVLSALAALASTDARYLGDVLLAGAGVHVVKRLRDGVADGPDARPARERITARGMEEPFSGRDDSHLVEDYWNRNWHPMGGQQGLACRLPHSCYRRFTGAGSVSMMGHPPMNCSLLSIVTRTR